MTLPPFSYLLAGGLSLGYLALLSTGIRNRAQIAKLWLWLAALLVIAFAAQAIHIVHPRASEGPYAALFVVGLTQPALAVYLTCLMLAVFVAVTFRYVERAGAIIWLIVGLAWWIGLIASGFLVLNRADLGQPGWFAQAFVDPIDIPSLIVFAGWAVIGIVALVTAFSAFAAAHLPEIGNRALFWGLVTILVLIGAPLGASGNETLKQIGWLAQFVGIAGALSGALTDRVVDVRRTSRLAVGSAILTLGTAAIVLIALLIGRNLDPAADGALILLALLALAAAIVYAPVRSVLQGFVNRLIGASTTSAVPGVARHYSEDIAGVVDLDELVEVATRTLREALRVRRGALLLATRDDDDTIRLEPVGKGNGDLPDSKGWIPKNGAIYQTLFDRHATLSQFDLEYGADYRGIAPELALFFRGLRMGAYAPIIVEGQLSGILAVGQKLNDAPFTAGDLEVLATVANQTGISLRTARLVKDLLTARDETGALNEVLTHTKERLEKLDSVKTDFITVASHELRTPLAQIRGYTDILDALNDQETLNPEQIGGLTGNLRKATDRLERLIGDMLDVSQLDTDAMDLRFAQTTVENVMRLAIEPLTEDIKRRKLTLVARGLRGLAPVEADMQRLVQAFRNVVLNAIKFTPDGGRIEITGSLQKNAKSNHDEILIAIQDTGIGIDRKNFDLIFEKFFRVSDPGLHSTGATKFLGAGPGLGLTIARGVIQGHGGLIWVESPGYDPQKFPGSTFYITLPLSPPADAIRVIPFESSGTPVPDGHKVSVP